MTAAGWLGLMPVISLRGGVPVGDGATVWTVLSVGHELDDGRAAVALWDGPTLQEVFYPVDELRVDLCDPLGFGHALMVWATLLRERHGDAYRDYLAAESGWRNRWLLGRTTDLDRIALARALRELSGVSP